MWQSIKDNIFIIKYLFKFSKSIIFCHFGLAILTALPEVLVNVIVIKKVLEIVISGVNLQRIFIVLTVCLVAILLIEGLRSFCEHLVFPSLKQKTHICLQLELFRQAEIIDIQNFDDPNFYNEVIQSIPIIEDVTFKSLEIMTQCLQYIVQLVLVGTIFLQISIVYLLFIFVGLAITLLLNSPIINNSRKQQEEMIPSIRKKEYFSNVFYSIDSVKELRLYNKLPELLRSYLHKSYQECKTVIKKYARRRWKIEFAQISISGLIFSEFLVIVYLGYSILIKRNCSLSDFSAIYNGVGTILAALFYLVGPFVSLLAVQSVSIQKFRKFLNLKSTLQNGKLQIKKNEMQSISLERISFSYKPSVQILSELTLNINRGQKIAIVGANGSGKTTLVKLLLRLYDPQSGSIAINNTPIIDFDITNYRSLFSTIFQDFVIIPSSIGSNVALDVSFSERCVIESLVKSGYITGNNTINLSQSLLRTFDKNGLLLSGGQLQRIALARIFYQDSDVVIMDEPSAALDPFAEYQLNKVLHDASNNKTVIFISHRLSTTKQADWIYYLQDGKIFEQGTHEQLLSKGGAYYNMWKIQSKKYNLSGKNLKA
mgnify:CR=1 FL=1